MINRTAFLIGQGPIVIGGVSFQGRHEIPHTVMLFLILHVCDGIVQLPCTQ